MPPFTVVCPVAMRILVTVRRHYDSRADSDVCNTGKLYESLHSFLSNKCIVVCLPYDNTHFCYSENTSYVTGLSARWCFFLSRGNNNVFFFRGVPWSHMNGTTDIILREAFSSSFTIIHLLCHLAWVVCCLSIRFHSIKTFCALIELQYSRVFLSYVDCLVDCFLRLVYHVVCEHPNDGAPRVALGLMCAGTGRSTRLWCGHRKYSML